MKRIALWLAAFVAILVGLASLAFVFRSQMAGQLVPHLLENFGFQQVEFSVRSLEANEAVIERLSAQLPLAQGNVGLVLKGMRSQHSLNALLHGRLNDWRIEVAELTLPPFESLLPASEAPSPVPRASAVFAALKPLLHSPLHSLWIERLELRMPMQGKMTALPPVQARYEATANGRRFVIHEIDASKKKAHPLRAALELDEQGETLALSLALELADLTAWLPLWKDLAAQGSVEAEAILKQTEPDSTFLALNVQSQGLRIEDWSIGQGRLELNAVEAAKASRWRINRDAQLLAQGVRGPGFQAQRLKLNLASEVELSKEKVHARMRPANDVEIEDLAVGGTALTPFRLRHCQAELLFDRRQTQFLLGCDSPKGAGKLKAELQMESQGQEKGRFSLASNGPLRLSSDDHPLLLLAKKPSLPAIEQGNLQLWFDSSWRRDMAASSSLRLALHQGAIRSGPWRASGLSLQQELSFSPRLHSTKPGTLSIAQLDGPISLTEVRARGLRLLSSRQGPLPILSIEGASAQLFDGQCALDACGYDFNAPAPSCVLRLQAMDLARIVELHKVDGLAVSGRIQGDLPFKMSTQGLQVEHGHIRQDGVGGRIAYTPSSRSLSESRYGDYVLKALENFNYHHLEANLAYEPDGNMAIDIRLQGKSPQLDPNRPVRLNLHLEQNLLSLLKSLQYSQGLVSEIDNKAQQKKTASQSNR